MLKHQRAFTLIEILVVVVILGILAAVIIPQFTNATKDAIGNSMAVNAKLIRTQIEYHAQKGDVDLSDDGFPENSTPRGSTPAACRGTATARSGSK